MSRDTKVYAAIFGIGIAVMVIIWIVASVMEADIYTRVTGKRVSTWEAMWVEFRVQESVK